jgi:hypothetical protein
MRQRQVNVHGILNYPNLISVLVPRMNNTKITMAAILAATVPVMPL